MGQPRPSAQRRISKKQKPNDKGHKQQIECDDQAVFHGSLFAQIRFYRLSYIKISRLPEYAAPQRPLGLIMCRRG